MSVSQRTSTRNSEAANAVKRGRECLRYKYWSLDIIDEAVETGYAMDSLLEGGDGAVVILPCGGGDELLPLIFADAYATASPDDDEFREGGGDREVDAGDGFLEELLMLGSMTILDRGERNLMVFFLESGESSTAELWWNEDDDAPPPLVGSEAVPPVNNSTSSKSPVDDEVRRITCD
jgi:hypothetical protein